MDGCVGVDETTLSVVEALETDWIFKRPAGGEVEARTWPIKMGSMGDTTLNIVIVLVACDAEDAPGEATDLHKKTYGRM